LVQSPDRGVAGSVLGVAEKRVWNLITSLSFFLNLFDFDPSISVVIHLPKEKNLGRVGELVGI
jgi:hypothetical protein